jgi:hypothetical protein
MHEYIQENSVTQAIVINVKTSHNHILERQNLGIKM